MFSHRTDLDRAPNPFEEARARAVPRLDLTVSNPTRAALPVPAAEVLRSLGDPVVADYEAASFGLSRARETVARAIGAELERVVLTASTSEAYGLLFRLLCDPGDAVLAPTPSYPLFDHLARFDGIRLAPYELAFDGEWWPALPAEAPPDARAVLVVSPNNPTGTVFGDEAWSALRRLRLPVIIDEVFADFALEGPVSDGASAGLPLAFVLGGLSKRCGLPQMKLGWIRVEGDPQLVAEALARLEILADAYLSVGTPVQHAAAGLLAHAAPFQEAVRARTRANLATARTLVRGTALSIPRVDGGWYACVRVPGTRSDEAWALALLEHGVRVQPGYFYDLAPGEWLVVSLLTPEPIFAEGFAELVALVEGSDSTSG